MNDEVMLKARCQDCGLDYSQFGLDFSLPNDQWDMLNGSPDGLLCATCICRRAASLDDAIALRVMVEFKNERPCGCVGHDDCDDCYAPLWYPPIGASDSCTVTSVLGIMFNAAVASLIIVYVTALIKAMYNFVFLN